MSRIRNTRNHSATFTQAERNYLDRSAAGIASRRRRDPQRRTLVSEVTDRMNARARRYGNDRTFTPQQVGAALRRLGWTNRGWVGGSY